MNSSKEHDAKGILDRFTNPGKIQLISTVNLHSGLPYQRPVRPGHLCIGGKGPMQIAKILKKDKVPTAKAYYAEKKGKALPENPYNWKDSTIVGILERMDYCGHTVNFKSYSKSHKLKKRIPTTKEQQAIFFNTHEAIVEDAVFERVQVLRANKRRPTKAERQGLFSGLVYCADCGSKLHFATCRSFNGSQDHYRYAKYKSTLISTPSAVRTPSPLRRS